MPAPRRLKVLIFVSIVAIVDIAIALVLLTKDEILEDRWIAELLASPDEKERAQAVRLLGEQSSMSAESTETLCRRTEDPSPRVRLFATEALQVVDTGSYHRVKFGEQPTAEELEKYRSTALRVEKAAVRGLVDEDTDVRIAAIGLVSLLNQDQQPLQTRSVEEFIRVIRADPDLKVRAFAVESGSWNFSDSSDALSAVVRRMAVYALRDFGKDAEPAVDRLILLLEDSSFDTQEAVIDTLGQIGPKAARAAPALLAFAKKSGDLEDVALRAAEAIGADRADRAGLVHAKLRRQIDGMDDSGVISTIVEMFAEISSLGADGRVLVPTILGPIRREMEKDDEFFSYHDVDDFTKLAKIVAGIGTCSEEFAPILLGFWNRLSRDVDNPDGYDEKERERLAEFLQQVAIVASGTKHEGAMARLLIQRLDSRVPCLRIAAATGLGDLGASTKTVVAGLEGALANPHPTVRIAAVISLGPDAASTIPRLVKFANGADRRLRRAAVRALGQMGTAARSAIPTIENAAKGEHAALRREAKRALYLIRPSSEP